MRKNKIIILIVSFIIYVSFASIYNHVVGPRGAEPESWTEIKNDWIFYLISGFFIAGLCAYFFDFDKKK